MSDRPTIWKSDPLAVAQQRLEVNAALHREAGKRGFSCLPKQSNIDKRYFAEINQAIPTGHAPDGIPSHKFLFNVAMGTGDSPLEAAANGYWRAVPLDDMMATLYLEVELVLLSATVARVRARERAMEMLDETLHDLRHGLSQIWGTILPLGGPPATWTAVVDEDDDL